MCEEEITLAPQTEIFEEAKRIAAESAGAATDSFIMKYDANQKDFLIGVLTEPGCTVTKDKDETNTMTATMNMEQLRFLINLECVKNIHKVLIRNYLEEEILAARAAEKEESAASVATPMMLSANEEEGVAVASVQTVAETAGSSMATAISLPLESWVDGCICCPETDWIWYKFTVPSNAENTTYTVHTYGSLNMIGALCNSGGTVLASDNDGIKCKMVANLTKGATYYVKLKAYYQGETGGVHVRATTKTIVDSLSVQPQTIVLKTGVTYELPITIGEYSSQTKNTYPLVPITVSASPASPTETRVFWHIFDQNSEIEVTDCFYKIGKDENSGKDIYNEYTIVRSDENATATLYVYDWYQYGIRGTVTVTFSDEAGQAVRVNANNGLALWEAAGGTGTLLGTFENGTMVSVVDETPVNEKWFYVYGATSDGTLQYGWCSGEYLEKETTFLKHIVETKTSYVRNDFSLNDNNIVGEISYGMQVELVQERVEYNDGYDWHKIIYNDEIAYLAHFSGRFETVVRWAPLRYTESAVVEDRDLNADEKKHNARIIYNYLAYKGWSKNAICGAVANMEAESSLSPGRWEMVDSDGDGDKAYGLLQWDPPTKWTNYAQSHNYEQNNIYRQLDYFIYSTRYSGGEWLISDVPTTYQLYAYEYACSTRSVFDLAIVFMLCYERPEDSGTTEKNRRGGLAETWKQYFDSIGW